MAAVVFAFTALVVCGVLWLLIMAFLDIVTDEDDDQWP